MDNRRAVYIVNKKTKEIRDVMRFCRNMMSDTDETRKKSFVLLLRLMFGKSGAGERLNAVYKNLKKEKDRLYQMKYTVVHRDGKPVDVALKPVIQKGVPCSELSVIYEYETDLYHLPGTESEVTAAGLVMPKTYTDMAGTMTPSLWEPIPDEDLEEAVFTIMNIIGDDQIQTPPNNILKKCYGYKKSMEDQRHG